MTKEEFLKDVQNWDNHRFMLWDALELTHGDVIEMGMGDGSTPYLHQYCTDAKRKLYSFENNFEWYSKFTHYESEYHKLSHVVYWDDVIKAHPTPDVVLIDHAPGERRWIDVKNYAYSAKIIVIHDSEPAATGYMLDRVWGMFKYRRDHESPGAWATAVSDTITL